MGQANLIVTGKIIILIFSYNFVAAATVDYLITFLFSLYKYEVVTVKGRVQRR